MIDPSGLLSDESQMIPKAQDGTWKLWLVAPLMSGAAVLSLACLASNAFPQQLPGGVQGKGQMKKNGAFSKADYGKQELKEPFKGLTADGQVARGLFPIRSTGVSTGPVREAAEAFLVLLTEDQRAKVAYPINDIEWRKWSNVSWYLRQGLSLKQMTEPQRRASFGLMRASLSAKGFKTSQDIMRLNHTLGELVENFEEFDEDLYFFTVMGKPSPTQPWGWQLDGHHLVVNYFVLGDQVVMTPTFMGSEPAKAESGKYKGTEVLQVEQDKGLALFNTLDEGQRTKALLRSNKGGLDNIAEAFKDNIVLDYAGIKATELTATQKENLLDLIGEYVRNMDDGHAKVKMDDVRKFLDQTHFAWIGKADSQAVFYYRIHSPVVLIEFDHQAPGPLGSVGGGTPGKRVPTRQHIHTVVRTPNGGDYGTDLLRQHHEQHPHTQD